MHIDSGRRARAEEKKSIFNAFIPDFFFNRTYNLKRVKFPYISGYGEKILKLERKKMGLCFFVGNKINIFSMREYFTLPRNVWKVPPSKSLEAIKKKIESEKIEGGTVFNLRRPFSSYFCERALRILPSKYVY